MTLPRVLGTYLIFLHVLGGILGAIVLWDDHRPWILLLEVLLAGSLLLTFFLFRGLSKPDEMVEIGTQWMKEGDFSHSFRPVGTSDLKRLTSLYNQMIARLREERIRLKEQDVFLHKLINASPSGIIVTDYDGRIQAVNPQGKKLLGISVDQWIGAKPSAFPGSLIDQLAKIDPDRSKLIGNRGGRRLKCFHSVFFDRGFPRSFFVLEDLTHEIWNSEKRAYRTLIRTLSHEVNNTIGATNSILHSALVFGQQLREGDREEFSNALNVAIKRTDHLNAFMRRYAEVVRVPKPVLEPTQVHRLIRRVASLLEPECEKRNIRLEFSPTDQFPVIALDGILMEQVLVNVLRNAIDAVDRQGRITISTGVDSNGEFLCVEDSGPGLSADTRMNLFTPFFSTKADGQGIGLTLVKEILVQHGFSYSLDSSQGEPTRFRIDFGGERDQKPR